MGNLKTIIGSILITSLLWAGDQAAIGVVEGEKQAVIATAEAYENYKNPVAVVPEVNYSNIFK